MAKKSALDALSPFCHAEWVFKRGKGEIGTLVDGTLLDPFLFLRSSYEKLSIAGKIAQNLLFSQLPGKSAPRLYQLFLAYLKQIALFAKPNILSSSFQLKILMHEGLFDLQEENFAPDEWQILLELAFTPTFSKLQQVNLSPDIEEKIDALFKKQI